MVGLLDRLGRRDPLHERDADERDEVHDATGRDGDGLPDGEECAGERRPDELVGGVDRRLNARVRCTRLAGQHRAGHCRDEGGVNENLADAVDEGGHSDEPEAHHAEGSADAKADKREAANEVHPEEHAAKA